MELPTTSGERFWVHAKPGASKTSFEGYDAMREAFVFRIAAVADKGRANAELLEFLKKEMGATCVIVAGQSARKKLLKVC